MGGIVNNKPEFVLFGVQGGRVGSRLNTPSNFTPKDHIISSLNLEGLESAKLNIKTVLNDSGVKDITNNIIENNNINMLNKVAIGLGEFFHSKNMVKDDLKPSIRSKFDMKK